MGILKKPSILLLVIPEITVLLVCSGCAPGTAVTLSAAEMQSLLEQVAKSDVYIEYGDYLKEEAFAVAEVFGVRKDGDRGTAYVYLDEEAFVVLKGKAYAVTGSVGETIIRFIYTDSGVALSEVVWGDDGDLHEDWIKKNYPAEYRKKAKAYQPRDLNGDSILDIKLREKVEATLGVPVESDDLLEIDADKGTYKIIKTIDGDNGSFDMETVEQGSLADLAEYHDRR